MPENGSLSNSKGTFFTNDSSWSSNSETFPILDIKENTNQINKQWNAIERTLYGEEGEHVTDPDLLKECKLWKESFPHLRVRGTKIEVGSIEEETVSRDVQTLQGHLNLSKIQEKRESIKNRVVGEIVNRLITRFNRSKLPNLSSMKMDDGVGRVEIAEVPESDVEQKPAYSKLGVPRVSPEPRIEKSLGLDNTKEHQSSQKESYFERGKTEIDKIEARIYEIFDSWDEELTDTGNTMVKPEVKRPLKPKVSPSKNFDLKLPSGGKIGLGTDSRPLKGVRNKSSPQSDSLSSQIKPFEIATKIDKKYEGLLNRIMKRNCSGGESESMKPQHYQNPRNTAKHHDMEPGTYLESLEKIRVKSGFDEFYKKGGQNLPKIKTFRTQNNWLDRGEINANISADEEERYLRRLKYSMKSTNPCKISKAERNLLETFAQDEMDDQLFRDLRKEIQENVKRPPMNIGVLEEINMGRPRPLLTFEQTKRHLKSSSCGDLPNKNRRNMPHGRPNKSGIENGNKERHLKSRTKFTAVGNAKQNMQRNGNNCGTLPPIESGIICTELVGRPKMCSKTIPKRR